jgi:Nif-specific regulatory protein
MSTRLDTLLWARGTCLQAPLDYHALVAIEAEESELARVQRERDFYRTLLDLGRADNVRTFLSRALELVIDITRAVKGYIEVYDKDEIDHPPTQPHWSLARGWSDAEIEKVRAALSSGVIAEAVATGRTVSTGAAYDDPRFRDRRSVRERKIEAVLCAPIGSGPPLGVIYLQDRRDIGPFTEEDVARVEALAEHLAPFTDRLLIRSERSRALDATAELRKTLRADGFLGKSPVIASVLRSVSQVAPLDVSVLLTGPSGTGKTQLARIVHDSGPRSSKPFVEINCGALPENLMESELFGALAGAHSTATRKIEGKVSAAQGGTLFLDDVGELPLSLQPKLLQLLQSRTYFPLGGTKAITADVRIIAATNADLKGAVAERRFREDLFYRLHVLPIRVPSLAERREDVAELLRFFCMQASSAHRLPHVEPSERAIRLAESAEWPGNVRQLANAVEAAVISAAGEGLLQIEPSHLHLEPKSEDDDSADQMSFQQQTYRFQGWLLKKTLDATGWNIAETAQRLDLARSHVYNLIKSHGFNRKRH